MHFPSCRPATGLAFFSRPRHKEGMASGTQHAGRDHQAFPANDLLLQVGAARDRAAFVRLFEYYAPRLKSWLLKNGASDSVAEEIVQNTFITVWEKAAKYDPDKAAASTWIFTVARNKRIDALRRERHVTFDSGLADLAQTAEEAPENYADKVTVEKLGAAIEQLSSEQAEVLRMAFFEDKSHSAIAQETHLPLGTVKSRLRLALEKLRKSLKGNAE